MELRYQRELYRVQVCCDTDKEEAFFGYPLQMCLRNAIPGILPCHGQTIDGKFSICWDITARHNLSQIVGEGSLSVELLFSVMENLQSTMERMERFLIPCEYLSLEPEHIYLESEHENISFLCDFGEKGSFHTTLLTFGEYVLAHMDHRNQEAMRLGYGLYRLAVEDVCDREAFASLLQNTQPRQREDRRQAYGDKESRLLSEGNGLPVYGENITGREEPEETREQRIRRETLQSFFAEDEEIQKSILPPKKIVLLSGLAVILGMLIMEGVMYFRNGRHLSFGWLIIGGVVLLMTLGAFLAMEVFFRWKDRTQEKKSAHGKKTAHGKTATKGKRTAQEKTAAQEKTVVQGKKAAHGKTAAKEGAAAHWTTAQGKKDVHRKDSVKNKIILESEQQKKAEMRRRNEEHFSGEICADISGNSAAYAYEENAYCAKNSDETTVLKNHKNFFQERSAVLLCEDGKSFPLRGEHWLIGKRRAEVDICLEKTTVSRLHARIFCRQEEYFLEDLNSRNGTWLNGHILNSGQPQLLKDGDEIVFADYRCTFGCFLTKK